MTDTAQLAKLLKLFFGFERPEIADFRRAVEQFKTDLPAVLKGLRGRGSTLHRWRVFSPRRPRPPRAPWPPAAARACPD